MSRVVLVTARWGDYEGELGAVLRLLAGALSVQSHLEVVSLSTSGGSSFDNGAVRTRRDGAFSVHEIDASPRQRAKLGLVRAALALDGEGRIPETAGPVVLELAGGEAPGACELITSLEADSVVLAGPETWWLPAALASSRTRARVVSVPLLGDDPLCEIHELEPLLFGVEAVGVLSHQERRRVAGARETSEAPPKAGSELVELDVAFAVNRPAAEQLMVGMSHFGRFVVLLTGFPESTPQARRSPGHDYVRQMLGPLAVAEVALDRWLVTDREKTREVPVGPSRPNLWKLLSHAEVCLDLRPQGIVGRETIESLALGTPVVVPEGTIAAEHAERSNGGLWYRDYGEMFSAAKAVVESPSLRAGLSRQGREWAERLHGDQGRFGEQVAKLAFG